MKRGSTSSVKDHRRSYFDYRWPLRAFILTPIRANSDNLLFSTALRVHILHLLPWTSAFHRPIDALCSHFLKPWCDGRASHSSQAIVVWKSTKSKNGQSFASGDRNYIGFSLCFDVHIVGGFRETIPIHLRLAPQDNLTQYLSSLEG